MTMAGRRPRVAFVGSGGAAKGIAHLGVLRACEELGIVPDVLVGASAGAIVAATYGQGISLDVLLDSYRLPWKRRHPGRKLTEARIGLVGAGSWTATEASAETAASPPA